MITMVCKNRIKQIALLCCLVQMKVVCNAQIKLSNFEIINGNQTVDFDIELFKTDTIPIRLPDLSYLETITKVQDEKIVDRCLDGYRYVFPLKVEFNDSYHVCSFTAAGLYSLGYNETMSMNGFQRWLVASLQRRDTIRLERLPTAWVGSANYLKGESYDVEFVYFRESKWAFLNYYFSMDESGLWYNFLGYEPQIPLVVTQLYSWDILVIDGAGTDQRSTIAILKNDYPDYFDESDINQGHELLSEWVNIFGNKRLFRKSIVPCSVWAD